MRTAFLIISSFVISFAHAETKNPYEVLGVANNATLEEIKAQHKKLAKLYHPNSNAPTSDAVKFQEVQEAYELLSDGERRAQFDRWLAMESGPWTYRPPPQYGNAEVMREFFKFDKQGSLRFNGRMGQRLIRDKGLQANLETLSFDDIATKSPTYRRWQIALGAVTESYAWQLKHLADASLSQTAAGRSVGRHGNMMVWTSLLVSGYFAIMGSPDLTRLIPLGIFLSVPAVAHLATNWYARGDLNRALGAIETFTKNIGGAKSQAPLVNAVAGYDFVAQTFRRFFHHNKRPRPFERLRRTWLLRVMRKDTDLMRGWLYRELQADASNLNHAFWRDLRGYPKRWLGPLESLVAALPESDPARAAGINLLQLMQKQGPLLTLKHSVGHKVGWTCELVLANVDAAFVTRSSHPRARWKR